MINEKTKGGDCKEGAKKNNKNVDKGVKTMSLGLLFSTHNDTLAEYELCQIKDMSSFLRR